MRGAGRKGKERHRRSSRIADATWEEHRSQLCELWESCTLAEVMDFMKKEHKFTPSKRQYGYRFKKWEMKKYNSADKTDTPQNSAKNGVSPDFHVQRYRSGPRFLDVPTNYSETAYHAPSNASGTPSASDVDAEMSFVDEDTDSEDNVSSPGSPALSIRYSWEFDDEVKKLVTDFCAATLDEENSFVLGSDLLGSLASSSEASTSAKNLVIISFARVARQPKNAKNAKIARELLTRHREQAQQSGFDRPFVFSMLDANMEEQEHKDENLGKDALNRRICDNIRKVLIDDTTLGDIPHNYSAIDLVAYGLLSSGLEVYAKTPAVADGPRPTLLLGDLLYQYVVKQPFAETISRGESTPLHVCITWCAKQLQLNHKIPSEVASIPRDNAHGQCCDNVQLFCTLWHAMLMSVQNDTPPPWYGPCESALGISPSELLITVCWMLGDEAKSAPDSHNNILQRADAVAKSMARLLEPELWTKFLRKFIWIDKLVELNDEDKAFEAVTLQHTRRYISATLKVPLPFPAEESLPPGLPFLADESLPPSPDYFAELDSFTIDPNYGNNAFFDGFGSMCAM
ncbi:hypothetical protein QQX98_012543 [Neonectria punicea]|uniref:Clr5 domain-containing protein n=1 Tax=Neonectria punicea TaxID=979145 RepID=A0ABR1GIX3_9HYPO